MISEFLINWLFQNSLVSLFALTTEFPFPILPFCNLNGPIASHLVCCPLLIVDGSVGSRRPLEESGGTAPAVSCHFSDQQ